MRYPALLALLLPSLMSSLATAAVKTETVEYRQGDTVLQGYVAYDDATSGKRPGVLVVPDWMGVTDYAKARADELASLGYVAFLADIYGKDVRPSNASEAAAQAGKYKADRPLLRELVKAALAELQKRAVLDQTKVAAIGYCFGGTTVLELARTGANIAGVVTFHGGLDSPNPADGKNIKAKLLILHGADDPFVKPADLDAFQKELRDAKVDWQMVFYANAVHSFTIKNAGSDNSKGAAYNASADRRSWIAMKDFFREIFAE